MNEEFYQHYFTDEMFTAKQKIIHYLKNEYPNLTNNELDSKSQIVINIFFLHVKYDKQIMKDPIILYLLSFIDI